MTDGLKPIETCPNGHRYNTWKYDNVCPVCGAKIEPPEKEQTPEERRLAEEKQIQDQVCGWLVCVKGPNKGGDFRLRAGKNFIGADPNMDVYVKGDRKISRINHAVIMYDEKTRNTMLLPGDSKGMVYHKNEAVYAPLDLAPMDEIELGESVFYFIPFCGGTFDWQDLQDNTKSDA